MEGPHARPGHTLAPGASEPSRSRRERGRIRAAHLAALLAAAVASTACAACAEPRSPAADSPPSSGAEGSRGSRGSRAAEAPPTVHRLLALQEAVRRAHLDYDAGRMASLLADTVVEVSEGDVARRTRAEMETRFAAYFDAATFLEWSDLDPPAVAVASSGDLATARLRRRVRAGWADTAGHTRLDHRVFAWTERWERGPEGWRLAAVTSTERPGTAEVALAERAAVPDPPSDSVAAGSGPRTAGEVLERARALVGGDGGAPTGRVRALTYVAEGSSPRGGFLTVVRSHGDGRVVLIQRTTSGERVRRSVGPLADADVGPDAARAFLQGHALLHLAADPEAVLGPGRRTGTMTFAGETADAIAFRDGAGNPLDLLYARESGRLLGARIRVSAPSTSGPPEVILVYLSGWRETEGLLLPRRAAFLQGEDLFLYRITEVRASRSGDPVPPEIADVLEGYEAAAR